MQDPFELDRRLLGDAVPPVKRTDTIKTKQISGGQWWAYHPGREALGQGGDSEAEAIGRLWFATHSIEYILELLMQQDGAYAKCYPLIKQLYEQEEK